MPSLEIRRRSGAIETRELSKDAPLLIGQLPSNDIQVDADGVEPIHCRISWNRKRFEIASVGPEGVQFNGETVRTSPLTSGDVIRVGDVDIVLLERTHDDRGPLESAADDGNMILSDKNLMLRAITEDELPLRTFHIGELPEAAPPDFDTARQHAGETDSPQIGGRSAALG